MRDPWDESQLAEYFRELAHSSLPRAPLNAAISRTIAATPSLSSMLGHAPPTQRQPVLLLAVIHHLVLDEPDSELAAWYPNLAEHARDPEDPTFASTLRSFVQERAAAVLRLVATRRTQTNEVGRCGFFLPVFEMVADEVADPLVHIDVGTSGGLNLLLPHFAYRYDDDPPLGHSPVLLEVGTRGIGRRPTRIPAVAASVGLDSHPIDIGDPVEARWLEACCWPDQTDRFRRLRAAIALAAQHPPDVVTGDAVCDVADLLADRDALGHPVITTSWVLNYFTPEHRRAFFAELDRVAASGDLSWIAAESPAQTPEIPHHPDLHAEHLTELTLTRWRSGERTTTYLGTCHPHGYWIRWR